MITVGDFLIEELLERGVRHIFGVPGDTVLDFYKQLERRKEQERARGGTRYLETVNTCDEQGAGFAADSYARLNGLGVVCVTWDVGGLKVANAAAEAYAERTPLLIISGAPSHTAVRDFPRVHHLFRHFRSQLKIFQELTEAASALKNPKDAGLEIVRLLDLAQRERGPVYLEAPADLFVQPYEGPSRQQLRNLAAAPGPTSDPDNLHDAVTLSRQLLEKDGANPVILAGVELHRFDLQRDLRALVDKTQMPVAANLLGKSVLDEAHPCYIGVYWGRLSAENVRQQVEESRCVLQLGVLWTDMELGFAETALRSQYCIQAKRHSVQIGLHEFDRVWLGDFLRELARQLPAATVQRPPRQLPRWETSDRRITIKRLFERLNAFLTADTVVVADAGDSLFGSRDLITRENNEFVSPAYYLSMGFAVPAGVGAQLALRADRPRCRPLVLVGDGAFQMTGMELSTAVRYGCNPIVVVLNNDGYTTERFHTDGEFNNLVRWNYSRLHEVLGSGRGCLVETERDLDRALAEAEEYQESFYLIDVRLERFDASDALQRLWSHLRESNG
jgi:indolepyruvate decarboxylase